MTIFLRFCAGLLLAGAVLLALAIYWSPPSSHTAQPTVPHPESDAHPQ